MSEISSFHLGSPYGKQESRTKGKGRKYPSKNGWIAFDDILKLTGFSRDKIFRELKFRSVDQILELAGK